MPSVNRDVEWVAEVGQRLRLFADRKGIPHKKLASEMGAKPQRFANWLAGKSPVDIACAVQLCAKYDVPLDWLYLGKRGHLSGNLDALLYPTK